MATLQSSLSLSSNSFLGQRFMGQRFMSRSLFPRPLVMEVSSQLKFKCFTPLCSHSKIHTLSNNISILNKQQVSQINIPKNLSHHFLLNKQTRLLSRYIVAKSELAGTTDFPAPDAAAAAAAELQSRTNIRGILFYLLSGLSAIFLFIFMLLVHPFVLLFDCYRRKPHHLIAKIWATLTVIPFYHVKFEGLENLPSPDTPAVYVSNHQSFLDIYTLLTLGRSFKFISKTAIFLIPIIGWAMYLLGTIPLKRMDSRSQLESLKRSINLLKQGASVFFFPEGTRSKDGKLGIFKKGAFSIAVKTKVPVVPITLIGTGKIMPAGMEGIVNPGIVKVVIHKPIQGSDPELLCSEARKIISDTYSRSLT